MRFLVTRPQPDADALCERLRAMGHAGLIDPLMSIAWLEPPRLDLDRCQAVVATSRNALRALARHPERLADLVGLPLFAVGAATADLARSLGFARVVTGPGDAAGLAEAVRRAVLPAAGPVLNLTGEISAFAMAPTLTACGFTVTTAVVYRAHPAQVFLPETLVGLQGRQIDAVLLMSARTARTYATLVTLHNQLDYIRIIPHLCLSEAVARALRPLAPLVVRHAVSPNLEELLALADSTAKRWP